MKRVLQSDWQSTFAVRDDDTWVEIIWCKPCHESCIYSCSLIFADYFKSHAMTAAYLDLWHNDCTLTGFNCTWCYTGPELE